MAFITDFTDPGYNAYSEVTTIDDKITFLQYVNGSIGWEDMAPEAKQAHIINATRSLCEHDFIGALNPSVITNNCMHFPRTGLEYENGTPVPSDEVPVQVHDYVACYIYTWVDGNKSISGGGSVGMVRKKKVKNVEIEYETGSSGVVTSDDSICLDDNIPNDWIDDTETTIGGVGSVGKLRFP